MALLSIRDLRKTYRAPDGSSLAVLDIPRFELEGATQVALRGASGSGKTTLLHAIAGIIGVDAGEIVLDDHNLHRLTESERDRLRARTLGYVFQTFNLLPGFTSRENVELGMLFGPGVDPAFAEQLLERVGLADRMTYRPPQLSIGQQQRVAVARALANRPKLVLADEPTGNLDVRRAHEALALIREVCAEQNAALLLVSHDESILAEFETVHDLAEINRALQAESAS